MPIYAPYPAEATVLNLQGEDLVSSNAGPVAAGVAVLGNLVDRNGVGNGAAWLAWRYHWPLIPRNQLGRTINKRPVLNNCVVVWTMF
jgi:hypothetical protein